MASFSKKWSNMHSNQFFTIFSENTVVFFLRKLLNKKIFSIRFVIKKGYVHFRCKMTLTGRTVTQRHCCKPTVRNITLLTHFLRQRFLFRYNRKRKLWFRNWIYRGCFCHLRKKNEIIFSKFFYTKNLITMMWHVDRIDDLLFECIRYPFSKRLRVSNLTLFDELFLFYHFNFLKWIFKIS